jgi:excisionase family DNA binding protein
MTAQQRTRTSARAISEAEPLLTIREACQLLNVHANTLRRWGEMGMLRVRRIGPRGDRRFRREDIEALLADRTD